MILDISDMLEDIAENDEDIKYLHRNQNHDYSWDKAEWANLGGIVE